MQFTESPAGM